ncbi:MAG: PilT/PilU family type 4a pilus ATPase [Gemmatimonadales bacterium]|jgi:twitching motility protein PilT|nr:PilT/PilU family type 4a pilus ATPase [Gemmatimonadales bacterium]NCG33008.1 PilT/PilU family type 4a pilus ATPase [Pseudomonadota bacterium]MBT3497396.1 PilT/PilU family type 4a pilus ATPase [Gemmatimonadales bacterium]MBT3775796.1 PilT/PilU family type 4a pilus ATPase [Gemmatimonadales bacterium]MBT3958449.1 PilT/PilU family type 4a pilus ATPase [Gemmatimonadales bacterium]
MQELFKAAIERGASDIHIKTGDFIRARIHGELQPLTQQRLSVEQVTGIALKLIPHEEDRQNFDKMLDYDCSWGIPGVGRFRVNIMKQRGSPMIVMRSIPIEIPSTSDLGLPPMVDKIANHERGLILVTGVTGSGKSSTMAAMIDWMNKNKALHIVTLENPIEFLHRDNKSSISQRGIGTDTESFVSGLRAVLRQDPDVILIGEMRDKTTIETALKAAETGHLVVSTLHTKNATQTISRIIAVFPPEEQDMIRIRLAESLQAVLSQRLVQKKDGGRVAAMEIMPVTATIRDCIRDPVRMDDISNLIADGKDHYGSQTFDQHLMDLVKSGVVDFQLAMAAASNSADFDLKMNMFNDPAGGEKAGDGNMQDEITQIFGG